MDVFSLRDALIRDYADYVRSFIEIRDPRIRERVDQELSAGRLWPDPLIQLNPGFEPGGSVEDLVAEGVLHSECRRIFQRHAGSTVPIAAPSRTHRPPKEGTLGKLVVGRSGSRPTTALPHCRSKRVSRSPEARRRA